MIGDMTDEGTLFSIITQLNITTDSQFKEYFQTFWWPKATDAQLERLMELYPANSAAGSPFGTGYANELLPQYKRLAALIGDYSFEAWHISLGSDLSGFANLCPESTEAPY